MEEKNEIQVKLTFMAFVGFVVGYIGGAIGGVWFAYILWGR